MALSVVAKENIDGNVVGSDLVDSLGELLHKLRICGIELIEVISDPTATLCIRIDVYYKALGAPIKIKFLAVSESTEVLPHVCLVEDVIGSESSYPPVRISSVHAVGARTRPFGGKAI
jgi:hypothetical protein